MVLNYLAKIYRLGILMIRPKLAINWTASALRAPAAHLNVGAHFLWRPTPHVTFDFGQRKEGHAELQSKEQFSVAADFLDKRAAEELAISRTTFQDPRVIHSITPSNTGQQWIDRYRRGVSHAICRGTWHNWRPTRL